MAIVSPMAIPFLGEVCALSAALIWAFTLVLFKLSGESVGPLSLSLFKNVVGIILLLLTLPFVGGAGTLMDEFSIPDLCILVLSGVIGIAIADTMLFYGLNIIGVGLVSIMECVYAPTVVLFAWLLLAEQVAVHHFIGGGLVVAGVFVSSTHGLPPGRSRGMLLFGMLLAALAFSLMAVGIVIVKPIIETAPLIPTALIRLIGGTAVLVLIMVASPKRVSLFSIFKPSPVWKICLPASVLGMYLAMLLWIAGFKYTQASIAAILNQTSTIMALIFATLILKEPFTKRKAAAAILALTGVIVVTVWSAGG